MVGITKFPVDEIMDEISSRGYSYVERLPDAFDHIEELSRIGTLIPQYGNDLVRDIKPDALIDDGIITPYNRSELVPHTEWYEFPGVPPRYLALWCVFEAEGPGGETTLADGYRFLEIFTNDELRSLQSNLYEWRSQTTLEREGIFQSCRQPILTTHNETMILRFSSLFLSADDELSSRYLAGGRDYFRRSHVAIKIRTGGLLVWDNWRMLHARNGFADRRRHLRRVLIRAD